MSSENKESQNLTTKQIFMVTSKSIIKNNNISSQDRKANINNGEIENKNQNCEKIKKKKKKKKSKNRCCHKDCNKKLSITAIECKCKKKFCGLHRLPHQHACDYIEVVSKDELMKKCGLGGGNFSQLEKV